MGAPFLWFDLTVDDRGDPPDRARPRGPAPTTRKGDARADDR